MFHKLVMIFFLLTSVFIVWADGAKESFNDYLPLSIKEKADQNWLNAYEKNLKSLTFKSHTSRYALLLTRDLLAFEESFPQDPVKAAKLFHNLAEESDLMIKKGAPVLRASIQTNTLWKQSKKSTRTDLHTWGKASPDFVLAEISNAEKKGFPYQLPDLESKYPLVAQKTGRIPTKAEKEAAKDLKKAQKELAKDNKASAKKSNNSKKEEKKIKKEEKKTKVKKEKIKPEKVKEKKDKEK